MEIWRPIEATNGLIEVSNEGRVRSLLGGTPRVLKTQTDKKGYHRVRVTIERERMTLKVHREVAKAFIANPLNLPQVNHKDGDKQNNNVSNLEWISNRDNAHHAIDNGLWESVLEGSRKENERRKKPIIAYSESQVIEFDSVADAERYFDTRHISDVLKGKRSQTKGFTFQYKKGGEACANLEYNTTK